MYTVSVLLFYRGRENPRNIDIDCILSASIHAATTKQMTSVHILILALARASPAHEIPAHAYTRAWEYFLGNELGRAISFLRITAMPLLDTYKLSGIAFL